MRQEMTHFDEEGNARMVDVSDKDMTKRTAVAEGSIRMSEEAFRAVMEHRIAKGDVLTGCGARPGPPDVRAWKWKR